MENGKTYQYWLPDANNRRIDRLTSVNSVVIIGANGSGKSKLGAWMEQQDLERVHRIAAQRNINFSVRVPMKSYDEAEATLFYGSSNHRENKGVRWEWGNAYTTKLLDDFDDVLAALLARVNLENQYFVDACRAAESSRAERPPLPVTSFDRLRSIWDEVFPQRRIGQTDAAFYACPQLDAGHYSATQMSDGERSVLYLAAQVICLPSDKIIVMDEPEVHLHPSLTERLWKALERARPDCLFVYITHDVSFAASHRCSDTIWTKSFDGTNWELRDVPESDLPKELLIELLGNRKRVLFVEGSDNSYDKRIYTALFPEFYVVPSGSCEQVISNVKAYNRTDSLHDIKAQGIIDRDCRSDAQLEAIKQDGICVLEVAEIENLFLTEGVLRILARRFGADENDVVMNVTGYVVDRFEGQIQGQILTAMVSGIKRSLGGIDISGEKQLSSNAIIEGLDIKGIEKDINTRYRGALASQDYSSILKLFNDKSLAKSVGHFMGVDNKVYVDRAISFLESGLNQELAIEFRKCIRPLPE